MNLFIRDRILIRITFFQRIGMPNYVWTEFEDSVPMSTYLVAFIVSDLQSMQKKTKGGTTVRVWARSEALEQASLSLNTALTVLDHFEDYFQIKFPLPKIDMVALPDFSAGAMENWGLITYR